MDSQEFQDEIAMAAFGITRQQALDAECCISCKEDVYYYVPKVLRADLFFTEAGRREYQISAMCEKCFDALFEEN